MSITTNEQTFWQPCIQYSAHAFLPTVQVMLSCDWLLVRAMVGRGGGWLDLQDLGQLWALGRVLANGADLY